MHKRVTITFLLTLVVANACSHQKKAPTQAASQKIENPTNTVVLSSDVVWEKLNPARGEQSPQAGTLWGDRKGSVATGFLAKFVDGFSSPPHIHNVTYRAVVIRGLVHNDDDKAEKMWMPTGSFWTQPAGESHITSAKGQENIALVEIDQGPYLVEPSANAADNGERPINIDAANVVWLDHNESNWVSQKSNAQISFLLKKDAQDKISVFIKIPKNHRGELQTTGSIVHAVVVKGNVKYTLPQNKEVKLLSAGSYFGSSAAASHIIEADKEAIIYIRTNGRVKVN